MQDLHSSIPLRWISAKVRSIDSKIQGLGAIATDNIKK